MAVFSAEVGPVDDGDSVFPSFFISPLRLGGRGRRLLFLFLLLLLLSFSLSALVLIPLFPMLFFLVVVDDEVSHRVIRCVAALVCGFFLLVLHVVHVVFFVAIFLYIVHAATPGRRRAGDGDGEEGGVSSSSSSTGTTRGIGADRDGRERRESTSLKGLSKQKDERRPLARPLAGGETVGVTENRVCEQAPYMSRTGFEQACSETGFSEQAPNRGGGWPG